MFLSDRYSLSGLSTPASDLDGRVAGRAADFLRILPKMEDRKVKKFENLLLEHLESARYHKFDLSVTFSPSFCIISGKAFSK